jgi:pimeloyl-ACP methyl ester carboxylesterase
MNTGTTDLLTQWSTLSLDEISARLETGRDTAAAQQLFGEETVAEMTAAPDASRGIGPREAVVLLPGIMGSLLSSIRGVTSLIWLNPGIFLEGNAGYLELGADGASDASATVEIVPVGIEKLVYLKIALALRRECELYEFPYDWRRPIEYNADVLHTCLERWAAGSKKRFTLVGHSMGGIVSRAYLVQHASAAERRLNTVISLGTPYFGAANAIENIVLGNEMLALAEKLNSRNETKGLLLNMPSFYELLPAPPDLFPAGRAYAANWDLYDAAEWRWDGLRPDYLALAQRFHARLVGADPQVETVQIAGCNLDTTIAVERTFDPGEKPRFEAIHLEEGPDAGDGTVPLWSATLPKARMYYIQERHRNLPGNGDVIKAVLALTHGDEPELPSEIPPRPTGWFGREVETPISLDDQAFELRLRLADGTATAEDLTQFYFMQ